MASPSALPGRWRLALVNAGLPLVAVVLVAAAALLWGAWRLLDPTPDKHLVIATGPAQGAYEAFAQRYLPLLQAQGLTVTLRPTQGAADNLALLRDPASGVQAAFVQGGVDGTAAENSTLVSLGSVALEPLWLFYREDSLPRLGLKAPPDKLAQLAGWRIDTGPVGGGSGPLFGQLAAASGLPAAGLVAGESLAVNRVVALVQGRVDALALVSAPEAPLVQYLLQTPGVRLFSFAQAPAYARRFAFLQPLVLPRGVVDLAADQPPQDLQLVAATASLLVQPDLHPALMQLLLQAAAQAHAPPGWFHRRGEFPNPRADEWPLADTAERYLRNGPPWLQRYLPFWLANFIDRMWIVLLPLLAALLPLSRIVPPLVTLRLRSRVYRWYANLRAIEQALEAPGADLAALREEIERLDAQTEQIGVPLSFTNELYDLRAHIHLVRKRILARSGSVQPAAS
ncbi:MAG: C4-dicarboxylate ABC transporter substrate-binding protein [Rubrivivax sp.]|nr:C4-dicarboxylate ABC transporter substrate-binding protein [Rubrivivax sp.]